MKCPKCGWTGSGTDKFCRMCGSELEQEVLQQPDICPNCGKNASERDAFCRFCGTKIEKQIVEQTEAKQESEVLSAESDLHQTENNLQTEVFDEKVESEASQSSDKQECNVPYSQPKVYKEQAKAASNQKQISAFWWGVLSFLCPVVGFIMFALWHDTKKHAAKVCLINAIVSVALVVVFYIALYAFYFWVLANYGGINSIPLICAA